MPVQIIENNHRRLRLKFQGPVDKAFVSALLLLLSLVSLVVMLSTPAQILTCQANPGQDSVQCEAHRIRWWRSRRLFFLPQVQQATVDSRPVSLPKSSRNTDYFIRLETPGGYQQTFPKREPDAAGHLVWQKQRVAHLNQYFANPQPEPWVYRPSSRTWHIILVSFMMLLGGGSALELWRFVSYIIELDRVSGELVVTKVSLNGQQKFSIYRLDDIVRVEVNKFCGQYGISDWITWIVLRSGDMVCLTKTWESASNQRRAAELINQFLGL